MSEPDSPFIPAPSRALDTCLYCGEFPAPLDHVCKDSQKLSEEKPSLDTLIEAARHYRMSTNSPAGRIFVLRCCKCGELVKYVQECDNQSLYGVAYMAGWNHEKVSGNCNSRNLTLLEVGNG